MGSSATTWEVSSGVGVDQAVKCRRSMLDDISVEVSVAHLDAPACLVIHRLDSAREAPSESRLRSVSSHRL